MVACGLASESRHLPGTVAICSSCGVAVYLTDDTRDYVAAWRARLTCVACAVAASQGARLELTPLGRGLVLARAGSERQRQGLLEQLPDTRQKPRGLRAVEDPVVARHRQRHDLAVDDLATGAGQDGA